MALDASMDVRFGPPAPEGVRRPPPIRLRRTEGRSGFRPVPPSTLRTPPRTKERLETLRRQTDTLVHDFNNLLTVIIGANEALIAGLQEGGEQHQLAQESLAAAEQGAVLLRRLLSFSEPAATSPKVTDCGEAIAGAARFARHAAQAGVKIDVAPQAEPLRCAADRTGLESALLNLCINAGHATPTGGAITLAARAAFLSRTAAEALALRPGSYVVLSVTDTGVGMSAATLERATEPYFTTRGGRGGSGLGLSAVKDFAERAGGRLHLASRENEGVTATLYLPRAAAAAG